MLTEPPHFKANMLFSSKHDEMATSHNFVSHDRVPGARLLGPTNISHDVRALFGQCPELWVPRMPSFRNATSRRLEHPPAHGHASPLARARWFSNAAGRQLARKSGACRARW
jgi:hypothetical protein